MNALVKVLAKRFNATPNDIRKSIAYGVAVLRQKNRIENKRTNNKAQKRIKYDTGDMSEITSIASYYLVSKTRRLNEKYQENIKRKKYQKLHT